ncbi:MAG: type II toxin-antitoxin system VapC family toxin [Thermoanaerobaculales bacterium]|nr:type II toxin-antitoxin system VapC family toxin [Thermoanaerobaculales bacterium]
MKYLLDTNICIYALKNRPPEVLERLKIVGPQTVAISVITSLELRHGAEKSRNPDKVHAKLDLFLSPIRVIPFDETAALTGARIRAALDRRGLPIGDFDSLIAAQALSLGMVLVSNNLREFSRVPGLQYENWVDEA